MADHSGAFAAALSTITSSSTSLQSLLQSLDAPTRSYPSGISLLSLKNQLLLDYLHSLVAVVLIKLTNASLEKQGQPVVEDLVKYRIMLEKMKTLEVKLKYQIDKLLAKADKQVTDDIDNDPLSFRPNPENLVRAGSPSGSEASDAETGTTKDGIYRPPRLAPVPYIEKSTKGKKEKLSNPSALKAYASELGNSSAPYAETTSGLSQSANVASQSARMREMADIQRYEEENFTRLWTTKKEAKRLARDQAEIALGGVGSLGREGKRGRAEVGFETEFADILGSMAKRRRNEGSQKAEREDGYDDVRAYKREKKRPSEMEAVEAPKRGRNKFAQDVNKHQRKMKKRAQ